MTDANRDHQRRGGSEATGSVRAHGLGHSVSDRVDMVIVGAGQAGLAVSRELTQAGVAHVVLERGRVGQTLAGALGQLLSGHAELVRSAPGRPYDGGDPDGFMLRDEVVAYLERYAAGFEAPVREGVEVTSLAAGARRRLRAGDLGRRDRGRTVVLGTGAYQRPHRPPGAATLPADLLQIDVEDYRNPADLPRGPVLVVGSGQSGCQIAEELHQAGREVFLACGRAPWMPRRLGDRDLVWWALETGFLDAPLELVAKPGRSVGGQPRRQRGPAAATTSTTGRCGRWGSPCSATSSAPTAATLASRRTSRESVAWGDERNAQLMDLVRKLVAERGLPLPEIPEPEPFNADAPEELNLSGFGAVVFAGGFRPDYESWVRVPGAFDELGLPDPREGASTVAPGLYFVGVHFLRKRKSALLIRGGRGRRHRRPPDRRAAGPTSSVSRPTANRLMELESRRRPRGSQLRSRRTRKCPGIPYVTLRTAGARRAGRPGSLCPSGRLASRPGQAPCPGRCRGTAACPGRRPRGQMSRLISSTRSFSSSHRVRAPLPCTCSSPAGLAFSSPMAAARSPERTVVFAHCGSVSVFDATYLGLRVQGADDGVAPDPSITPQ